MTDTIRELAQSQWPDIPFANIRQKYWTPDTQTWAVVNRKRIERILRTTNWYKVAGRDSNE